MGGSNCWLTWDCQDQVTTQLWSWSQHVLASWKQEGMVNLLQTDDLGSPVEYLLIRIIKIADFHLIILGSNLDLCVLSVSSQGWIFGFCLNITLVFSLLIIKSWRKISIYICILVSSAFGQYSICYFSRNLKSNLNIKSLLRWPLCLKVSSMPSSLYFLIGWTRRE